jgi:mannitol-specific phosphotransferase system IIBC component
MDPQRLAPLANAALAHVSPAWVLALILAAINVCVFQVAMAHQGRSQGRSVLFFVPFGILGFAAGNLLAWLIGSPLPMLGDLHVIEASAGAWVALLLANTPKA